MKMYTRAMTSAAPAILYNIVRRLPLPQGSSTACGREVRHEDGTGQCERVELFGRRDSIFIFLIRFSTLAVTWPVTTWKG